MHLRRQLCRFFAVVALCLHSWGINGSGMNGAAFAWTSNQLNAGKSAHGGILARFGGEIENKALTAYVRQVAARLIRRGPRANEPWVVTVLDTPTVNAFATQGGYVYVTRGLLALANSEAELAGVLGHEMAHITANHVQGRKKRSDKAGIGVLLGAVLGGLTDGKEGLKKGVKLGTTLASGYVAQYSQKQEFDADIIGMRMMTAAGYDPMEAAKFLASMAQKHKLEAQIAGKEYNPNQVSIFASHPATADRVAKANRFAQSVEMRGLLEVGEADYMRAIDGMIYGDSPAQGFVRGRSFIHPQMKFRYAVPKNFVITNSAKAVVARGPNGARFTLEGGAKADMTLPQFIQTRWAPALAKQHETGKLSRIERSKQNGVETAIALLPLRRNGQNWVALLGAVRHGDRIFRLTGQYPAGDRSLQRALADAVRSFAALSDREARRFQPYRIDTLSVGRGQSLEALVRQMPPMARAQERFVAMNGMASGAEMQRGDLVKLIVQ